MDRSELAAKLKAFIETECNLEVPAADAALDIDSFNMMLVITYMDTELGLTLGMDALDFSKQPTLNVLTDLAISAAAP